MMSAAAIQYEAQKAARHAKRSGYRPVVLIKTEDDRAKMILAWNAGLAPRCFPTIHFLGDYVPKGYTATDRLLFVDTSGFGSEREPALTVIQFLQAITPGRAYAIEEAGQFQAYIREYEVQV